MFNRAIKLRHGLPGSMIRINTIRSWKHDLDAGGIMTISRHAEEFYKRPVKVFESPGDWDGPGHAYRLGITWDDKPHALHERLDQFVAQKGVNQLQALIIGAWNGDDSSYSSAEIVKELVKHGDKLGSLKAIFLGDIVYEENEISWIEQSDVSPILGAYPKLELLRVRGGNSLKFSAVQHRSLQQLILEAGGLHRSVIREICLCQFPNLQHLELWLGVENYGWDGGVEDLQPILAGKHFPKLTYLGLRNSDIVDDITPVVVNAPILAQLQTLDLSNGTLTDVGARALLNLPANLPLRELNLTHHYMSEAMVDRLQKQLKCHVIADDGQNPDEEWRSVVVSE
jgi:hypothetical protein